MKALAAAGIKVVPTGIEHGTVTAVLDGKAYEITTLRRDVETDGRRAKVAFTDDWAADAARRDFTFNALYADETGRIYDYGGGLEDLATRRVRFIGDANERLREDVLRLLRYFRFLAQMRREGEPLTPDPDALAACRAAERLPELSAERVGREISRLLETDDPAPVWKLMKEECVLSHLLPDCDNVEKMAALVATEKSHKCVDFVRRLAALTRANHAKVAERLRLSKEQTARLIAAGKGEVGAIDGEKSLLQKLYDHGAGKVRDALLLGLAEGRKEAAGLLPLVEGWQRPVFPLRGSDLLALGYKSGPEMGQKLAEIEKWWREEDFLPTREECLKRILP